MNATKTKRLAPGFIQLPLWLKVSPELSTMEKAVYAEVVSYVRDNPSGWPAIETMARALSLSRSSVKRAIAALEEHRLIRVERGFGKVSRYFLLAHPWQERDKQWASAHDKMKRREAAARAAARREARQSTEPPSPWARQVAAPVAKQAEPKPAPTLSIVRPVEPVAATRSEDLRKVEQAWRASMTRHHPTIPVPRGDWSAASGPGASAAKLLAEYSAEQVIRYVAWVPEAWAGLQRQHPKLLGAPTMGIVASRWSESWMPQALGAAGAGSSEYDIAVAAQIKWMEEHPETVFAPDHITDAIYRARGKHGKL